MGSQCMYMLYLRVLFRALLSWPGVESVSSLGFYLQGSLHFGSWGG